MLRKFFKKHLQREPFLFLIVAISLIGAAIILDDGNLINFPHKKVVEESLELIAAIAILLSMICGSRKYAYLRKRSHPPTVEKPSYLPG